MDFRAALTIHFAIFPLLGGYVPTTGKCLANVWPIFQQRHPTPAEIQRRFEQLGYTTCGFVCGTISRLVVQDFDDGRVAKPKPGGRDDGGRACQYTSR